MNNSNQKYRCWAEVDLGALKRNIKRVQNILPPYIHFLSVLKADAMGHGLSAIAQEICDLNISGFAVANIQEGIVIRRIDAQKPILILGALLPEEAEAAVEFNLTPTLSCTEEITLFNKIAKTHKTRLTAHLKIDTGMGRMGVWHEGSSEIWSTLQKAPHIQLTGIYTHFADAESDPNFTNNQRKLFLSTLQSLPKLNPHDLMIHGDNTAGLSTFSKGNPFNAVRIGIAQHGELPTPSSSLANLGLEPTFSLHSRICLIKNIPQGNTLSYQRTHKLDKPTRIAIVAAGYGDGIPWNLSNSGSVLIHGKRCPIVGRVTMDQTLVDISELKEAQVGMPVTFLGKQGEERISIFELCDHAKMLHREFLCSITKRVPRVYIKS